MRDRRLLTLYLFYTVNFIAMGMTTFAPKFYGEIGLSDTRIGIISASMAAVALFAQPVWGALADRANYMRSVLAAALLVSGGLCFLVLPAMHSFLLLLAVLTLYNTFSLPAYPLSNAIAIEYTSRNGQSYGPVRMMGTVGYQAGILLTGLILSRSLMGLYPCIGITLFLAALCAILLPPVRGYQHSREKVSFAVLFRDRKMLLIFSVAFIANIAHQFNLTFFSRHLGDLGFNNTLTGLISTLSVILEIPFLLFGDRIMKRLPFWTWLMVGLIMESGRFLLMCFVRTPALIIAAQMLSISHLACFEFIPFVYLGKVTDKTLLGSVQSIYQMITFGAARIAASLIGGILSDHAGIPAVYGLCGMLLVISAAVFRAPLKKLALAESIGFSPSGESDCN